MSNKLFRIAAIAFVVLAVAFALTACATNEQSLDGMCIVTFELNGGVLDTGSTNVTGKIYHAYYPNDKAIDINKKFTFSRSGYVFDGWYTDEEFSKEWQFSSPVTENITLYAKWKSAIVYSYTVYLAGDGEPKKLGSYEVDKGETFADSRKFGTTLSSYNKTFLGYYSDRELTVEWNAAYVHPGGEASCDIPVYVKAMEGVWTFVSSYDELKAAASNGTNIWLTADVDCGGEELYFGNSRGGNYGGKLNGNNHTISNFKIDEKGTLEQPSYTLFGRLSADVKIYDVKFENAQFVINPLLGDKVTVIKISALALSAESGATVSNVSVAGTCVNSTSKALDKLGQAFYEDSAVVPASFVANIAEQHA